MSTQAQAPGQPLPDSAQTRKLDRRTWPTFRRLFVGYVLPHWKVGVVAILAMLALAGTQTGVVALIRPLLDDGFVEQDAATIRFYALLLIVFIVFQGVAHFTSHYLMTWIGRQLVKRLRLDVHDRLLVMPNWVFDQQSSGRLVSKLTYEAEQVAGAVTRAVLSLIQDGARVVFLLGYMTYLSPWLMLIVLGVLPVVGGIIAYITKRFRKISKRIHHAVGGVGSVAEESVHGYQVVKAFGQADRERQRFERVNERNRKQFMKFMATKYASVPLIRLVAGIALAVVIYLVTVDAVVETITVGTFVSFAGAILLLNPPLKSLVAVNATIQKGLTAAQSIFDVVDAPQEPDHGTRGIDRAGGHVELEGLRFSYDGEREVLRGIDVDVQAGETVALVGPSGSGKTTLVNLLPRFYEPTGGEIRLDGLPLQEYRLADLRRQFSMVGQNVMLFNASVADNIRFGAQGAVSDDQVRAAADAANATGFIEALPQGFETEVGEDGVLLSGGQRQRIAIARAVLKDAPILILDEATSALDTESERHIQGALERLMEGRTSFVIAHRLSTVENADQILFLDGGRIVERGTHRELLERGGRYAGLYRMQFEDRTDPPVEG
ncbi:MULTISPECIES: lipid A export permease/ATP-binding protein MsbA [unclassified Halorhodospira]|uniref:lipid A export permease/ATP-binding protein MsbA n=1 Tax=unclassified Halorhodospira TaxID=2626748 RepID=UPI001EE86FA7|nr:MULTISPECIES: lipid A export permease/ATP-binding protein MsbA [unclassified Halorhodospira]MCG5537501.1 lipid A export permease/ATP-binding protein MsbA [Halorhodospira sp. 9622]MCG5539830.1 lipid A export permease/ATP-binding protein MsbA [Halorhodospira sp. M39old]MCG5543044.1 lipid A export permease/ATP-binding protein MsbA [Halorhodospira sp. 9628]MCG5544720.1 lipid A export permease/ATP-binding protein MsbA [Halorhodospira sp. M38]